MLNLEKLEEMPLKETHRFNFLKNDFYGDEFKKSANEHFGLGYKYAMSVLEKHVNKSADGLISLLRNQKKSKHSSFKKAVNVVIKQNLLYRPEKEWLRFTDYFVDEKGVLTSVKDVLTTTPTIVKPVEKTTFKKDGKFFTVINGNHFFVNEAFYKYKTSHFYTYNWELEWVLSKTSVIIKQLNKKELKKHGLQNKGVSE